MKKTYQPKYWFGKGRFQKRYDKLYEKLVPASGDADTRHGQLLRYASKLYYDIYNNGRCNFDIYNDAIGFVRSYRRELSVVAAETGVKNFGGKIVGFTSFEKDYEEDEGIREEIELSTDKENDEVIDVVVEYVYRQTKGKK